MLFALTVELYQRERPRIPRGHKSKGPASAGPIWTNLKFFYRCVRESLIMRGVMNTNSSLRELLFVVVLNRLPT